MKQSQPRIGNCYGMAVTPCYSPTKATWIEGEMWNTDYGQFRRRGLVLHGETGKLVMVRLDVPDTYFSIPSTTKTENGYVTNNDAGEFIFRIAGSGPSPANYRKSIKQAYK